MKIINTKLQDLRNSLIFTFLVTCSIMIILVVGLEQTLILIYGFDSSVNTPPAQKWSYIASLALVGFFFFNLLMPICNGKAFRKISSLPKAARKASFWTPVYHAFLFLIFVNIVPDPINLVFISFVAVFIPLSMYVVLVTKIERLEYKLKYSTALISKEANEQ